MPIKRGDKGASAESAYGEWRAHAAALLVRQGISVGLVRERMAQAVHSGLAATAGHGLIRLPVSPPGVCSSTPPPCDPLLGPQGTPL
jgi:hypothetical protein